MNWTDRMIRIVRNRLYGVDPTAGERDRLYRLWGYLEVRRQRVPPAPVPFAHDLGGEG